MDDGVIDGKTSAKYDELVQLRRDELRLELEDEVLRRACGLLRCA